ncbi:TonB-dependent receptor [Paraflavisolibacter sp. H34]|uniref:SusC/RagA family TonB-linked outer membrane protein n=1 Tax=Huijunlia imazamoxiresistens TaxID=3127457 RepID=UPI00301A6A4D
MKPYVLAIGGMLLLSAPAFAAPHSYSNDIQKFLQAHPVTGVVTNEKGEPLSGVTVRVKGSGLATTTDAKGLFRLDLPTGKEVLEFSSVGFKPRELAIGGKATLNVRLEETASTLNDVVVIGYGTAKRKDLTGSISTVKAADIALSPVSSPMEALQGRVAGLDIQRTSGRAGTNPDVLLRGNRSIDGGQSPLYIIDGIQGNITNLNPNDIESIDVLKDASATAIYGVQGANGVIMITTKKAAAGKIQVDANSYYGVNGFASFPRPLDGDQWLSYMRDRYIAANGSEPNQEVDYLTPEMIAFKNNGQWVNWVDETLQMGAQQNHHLSLRGGTDKTRGYFSLGFIGEKGIYKNDMSKILNTRAGVDLTVNRFLKAGIQTIFTARNNDATNSRVNKAYGLVPLGVPYNEDGSVNLKPLGATTSTISPIANYAPGVWVDNSKNLSLNLNPYIELTPVRNLILRSNFGGSISGSRSGLFQNEKSYNLASENRVTKIGEYDTDLGYSYTWETFATYNYTLRNDHNFSVTALTSMAKSKNEESSLVVEGMDYDNYQFYNMDAGTNVSSRSTSYDETSRMSYGGRLNYSYKGKYLLTASNRWDGASQLYKNWASFPSVALAWRISDEAFMSNTKTWFSNLKLRASYGVTGNSSIAPYQSLTEVVSKAANLSLGGSSVLPVYVLKQALANPDLTWEKSYTTNLALDMSFLRNRIDLTAEVYHTNTDGVLYRRKMPFTSGGFDAKNAYTRASNIAETENRGVEITLNSKNISTPKFQWNSTLIFTAAREKLKAINLGNKEAATQLISEGLFPGQPLNTIYGYKKTGIWQLGEETEAALYGAVPGDIRLATVPKTGTDGTSDKGVHAYSAADRMVLGHENPDWFLGFQNSFFYKGLDLTVFMNMRYGQTINAQLLGYWNTTAQPASYNYWMPTNATNDFPKPGSRLSQTYQSALSIADGSYFKIKNVTLGYTLPAKIADKVSLSRLRVYGTAYNPLIVTKSPLLKDVDPETGGTDSFPLYKQIVFGVNVSF